MGRVALLLVAALALGVAAAWSGDLGALARDPERAAALLRESGAWGPLAFVVTFALLVALGVPGSLFMISAAIVWPAAEAMLLSWVGAVVAGTLGFTFARTLGREWVAERLPMRLRGYDRRIGERPLVTVLLVRVTLFLFPPAQWALGLSRVGVAPFLVGTAIGFVPGVVVTVLVGKGVWTTLAGAPGGAWLAAAVLLALVVLGRAALRRRARA